MGPNPDIFVWMDWPCPPVATLTALCKRFRSISTPPAHSHIAHPMPQPQTPLSLLFTSLRVPTSVQQANSLAIAYEFKYLLTLGLLLFPHRVEDQMDPKLCPLGEFSLLTLFKGRPE